MKTVTKTALANLKQNKGRNILSGIAIILTSLLLISTMTFGYGMIELQKSAVNIIYPTWHAMFRDVPEEKVDILKNHADVETLGKRIDVAQSNIDKASILFLNFDKEAMKLNKVELTSGRMPTNKDEIVLTKGLLSKLGKGLKVGDRVNLPYQIIEGNGLGYQKEGSFKIVGIQKAKDEKKDQKLFAAYVSEDFVKANLPIEERLYRVMFRINYADTMTSELLEDTAMDISQSFGVSENNVVMNNNYIWANYVDPDTNRIIAVIMAIIVFAGVIAIYSIYYVSNIQKVQEFGKLKALGATKKQIRSIVLREGLLVACIAIPIGIILGYMAIKVFFVYLINIMGDSTIQTKVMLELLESGKVSFFNLGIMLGTILISFLTVFVSLLSPMRMAGKISPIEALRYGGDDKTNAKIRKGSKEITLFRLAKANLSRNKKRTIITILTLGMSGILFMVISTVLSCTNPKEMAKNEVLFDHQIMVNSSEHDKMRPELKWENIQKNNPLNDKFEKEILNIDGVKSIDKTYSIRATLDDYQENDEDYGVTIQGLDKDLMKEVEKKEVEGNVKYDEMLSGDKVVVSYSLVHWFPEMKVGSDLKMTQDIDGKKVEKVYKVGAISDAGLAYYGDIFVPDKLVTDMTDRNITYSYEIKADESKSKSIAEKIKGITDNNEELNSTSYQEQLETWETSMQMMYVGCYVFIGIISVVGVMNLVNTMINSVYTRRRELGIMQAIGLSDKQFVKMIQIEGLFYTIGTLAVTFTIGNLAGYAMFLYSKSNHILSIKHYSYPLTASIIIALTIAVIQLLLTYAVSRSFKKQSLIDRIRFSE